MYITKKKHSSRESAGRVSTRLTQVPPVGPAPGSGWLHTQVGDRWHFTGHLPKWSDCEEPAVAATGGLPVINRLVLGLPFFPTAIFPPSLFWAGGSKTTLLIGGTHIYDFELDTVLLKNWIQNEPHNNVAPGWSWQYLFENWISRSI